MTIIASWKKETCKSKKNYIKTLDLLKNILYYINSTKAVLKYEQQKMEEKMKIKQINKQIIDWYDAKDKGKGQIMGYATNGTVYLSDGYMIYILNEKDCYFDMRKVNESSMLARVVEDIGIDELVSTGASLNNNSTRGSNGFINLYTYHDDKETTVGIDSKFLKHFENYTLKSIKGENIKPVGVYEYDEMVGIVLPIRLDESIVTAVRRK